MDHTGHRGRWTAPRGRGLFLLDAAGALLSALMLGVVLVRLEAVFGIPLSALQVLAALPLLFVAYDLVCYRWAGARVGLGLKGIACMNLVYCGVSLSLCLLHRASVTALGWAYILGEVTIVVALAAYEWRAASGAAGGE